MGPTWGPPGSCRPQMGPMMAPWTLLSGKLLLEIDEGVVRPLKYLSTKKDTQMDHIAPDSKVRGAYMGPIWGQQDPGGPHVRPMNFAIWGVLLPTQKCCFAHSSKIRKCDLILPLIFLITIYINIFLIRSVYLLNEVAQQKLLKTKHNKHPHTT